MRAMLGIGMLLLSLPVATKNLGSLGHTYPIGERSLLELIYERIAQLDGTSQMQAFERDLQQRAEMRILRPNPVGLPRTERARVYYYEPAVRTSVAIADEKGQIVVSAGQRINALDYLPSYQPVWLFINYDDPLQRRFATVHRTQYQDAHWILTGGNIREAEEALHVTIYFDQLGKITQKLGIQQVPAVVIRKGNQLRIEEIELHGDL